VKVVERDCLALGDPVPVRIRGHAVLDPFGPETLANALQLGPVVLWRRHRANIFAR
jgi:hypothetical protein